MDFCEPIQGRMYFVIVDAYSKWMDVMEMRDITASSTIKACKGYLSILGLPEYVVSDNGPAYASGAFREFLRINNVTHYLIPPYHPATNGAAENAVRTFKNKFKVLIQYMPREDALMEFSCCYRNTPHCTTGCTPSELHIGFKTRTRLDALKTAKKT